MAFDRTRYRPPDRPDQCACMSDAVRCCSTAGPDGVCTTCRTGCRPSRDLDAGGTIYNVIDIDRTREAFVSTTGSKPYKIVQPDVPTFQKEFAHSILAYVRDMADSEHADFFRQSTWMDVVDFSRLKRLGTADVSQTATPDICGTAHCFGGWATVRAGSQIVSPLTRDPYGWVAHVLATKDELDPLHGEVRWTPEGYPAIHMQHRARRLLGITDSEGDALFEGNNSIDRIEEILNEIERARAVGLSRDNYLDDLDGKEPGEDVIDAALSTLRQWRSDPSPVGDMLQAYAADALTDVDKATGDLKAAREKAYAAYRVWRQGRVQPNTEI